MITNAPSPGRTYLVLFLFFLVIAALYFAKPFLVPLAFATILSMLFYSLAKWLEGKGINRGFSSLLCVLTFISIVTLFLGLLAWQLNHMSSDFNSMQEQLMLQLQELQMKVQQKLGISKAEQEAFIERQKSGGSVKSGITTAISSISGLVVDMILMLVYFFLLLYLRKHLKKSLHKIIPEKDHSTVNKIMFEAIRVSYKYLSGMALMIVCLWILYGIGFTLIGVENALFFALLCGTLEIIPFIGNLLGTSITVLASLAQGNSHLVLGILSTYALIQFIQTYILEPWVVGAEARINPLFTIIVIVVGEMVWGIPGMVLALPFLGIVKVICDNIEPLQPYGYLIGEEKDKGDKISDKLKQLFSKKGDSESGSDDNRIS